MYHKLSWKENNMYEIFKNILNNKKYELVDILNKIDEFYIQDSLTKEQKEELEEEARKNANPINSYADLQTQIDKLADRITALENKQESTGSEEPAEEEYPEYVQPTGAHDAYKVGDKITYNGKHYECIYDGCVWTPDAYPAGWKLIERE